MIFNKAPRGILYNLIMIVAGSGIIGVYGRPLPSFFATGEFNFPIVINFGWPGLDTVTFWSRDPFTAKILAQVCVIMVIVGAAALLFGIRGLWRNFRD